MTRDDIIKLAREARLIKDWMVLCEQDSDALARFAALVAATEREVCADICDQHASTEGIAQRCAAAIRARGQS